MKQLLICGLLFVLVGVLSSFAMVRTESLVEPPTYVNDIRPVLEAHCLSCHGARKSTKRQLHTYAAVSSKIDDILYRVQLPTNNRKFMPYKMRQSPLNRKEVELLIAWKAGGLLE